VTVSKLSNAVSTWLRNYAVSEDGTHRLKDKNTSTRRLDVDRRAIDAFEALKPEDRLVALSALSAQGRSALLEKLDPQVRDATMGGGAPGRLAEVWHHDVGPEFEYDWSSFDFDAEGFSVQNARGLAIMSKRAYEDFGVDGSDPAKVGQGFEDFARQGFELRFFGKPGGNGKDSTQAFLATKGDQAILVFRGTTLTEKDDLCTDARFCQKPGYGGKVHSGFADGLDEGWGDGSKTLEQLQGERGPLKVHVTGHSLGAALATLASAKLSQMPGVDVKSVVALGSPRVFDDEAARDYDRRLGARTFRVVNNTDLVTEVPPTQLGYAHVGRVMYFDTLGRLRPEPTAEQMKADRDVGLYGDGALGRSFARGMPWSPAYHEAVWDHGPVGYCKHFLANPETQPYTPDDASLAIERYMSGLWPGQAQQTASFQLLAQLSPEERTEAVASLNTTTRWKLAAAMGRSEREAYPEVAAVLRRS